MNGATHPLHFLHFVKMQGVEKLKYKFIIVWSLKKKSFEGARLLEESIS